MYNYSYAHLFMGISVCACVDAMYVRIHVFIAFS